MAELTTRWEETGTGLRIDWRLGGLARWLRYAVGGPLLAAGLGCLGLMAANLVAILSGRGLEWIAGTLVLALLAALLLPLGWWMVLSRRHFLLPSAEEGTVVEVTDWRLGRKERRHAAGNYRAVALGVERLNPGTGTRSGAGSGACGIRVALLPKQPRKTPPLELGWFEAAEGWRGPAGDLAGRIGTALGLPVEDRLDEWFSPS